MPAAKISHAWNGFRMACNGECLITDTGRNVPRDWERLGGSLRAKRKRAINSSGQPLLRVWQPAVEE